MFLKWKGRSGLGLVALAAGAIALGQLIAASSPAVAGSGSGSGGSSGSTDSGSSGSSSFVADFAFTANYKPPTLVGYVVRGGLPSCAGCTTAVEPRYVGASFDCFYDSNTISQVSSNGFGGDVKLEDLNLPAGVLYRKLTHVV